MSKLSIAAETAMKAAVEAIALAADEAGDGVPGWVKDDVLVWAASHIEAESWANDQIRAAMLSNEWDTVWRSAIAMVRTISQLVYREGGSQDE